MSAGAAPITVLFNAGAGTSHTARHALQQQLGTDRFRVEQVEPDSIRRHVREAVASGARIIGVAGGDGTINAAASVLATPRQGGRQPPALLVVPMGTLNNFARRVGIHTVADAVKAVERDVVRTLPVGFANEHIFLNTLTFGEYSRVVRIREQLRTYVGKWPAAALAFGATCVTLRRFGATLTLPDRTLSRRTPFVWIGVGWGSFPRVDEALERRRHPDLEVAIVRSDGRLAATGFVLRMSLRMLRQQFPVRDRRLEVLHARSLVLDSGHRIDATADGEVLRLRPPVEVGVKDDALRVLTGPGAGNHD